MITVIESQVDSDEAFTWFRDKMYPEWDLQETLVKLRRYFSESQAREFNFYEDGIHIGFLATEEGYTLHYPHVVNISTVISPNADGNRALLRAMLEQAKQVCREAGAGHLVRSIHVSPSVSRVITTKIPLGG